MAAKKSKTAAKAGAKKKEPSGDVRWSENQRRAINTILGEQPPARQTKEFAEALLRSMIEPRFRKELLARPNEALRSLGVKLAGKTRFRVHENDAKTVHLVLPPKAGFAAPKLVLLDDDLKAGPLWQQAGAGGPVKKDLIFGRDPHRRDSDKARARDTKHPGSQNITDDNDPSHADTAMTVKD